MVTSSPPPKYIQDLLLDRFDVDFQRDRPIIAYHPKIHSLTNLTPDLIEHEKTHLQQQANYGVDEWWRRYFDDSAFRQAMEVEAYRSQYLRMQTMYRDRNRLAFHLHRIARDFSTRYGLDLSLVEAKRLITNGT